MSIVFGAERVRLVAAILTVACAPNQSSTSEHMGMQSTATSSGSGASEASGDVVCPWEQSSAQCEANDACLFREAGEVAIVDGECVAVSAEAGWCVAIPSGHADTPSYWYDSASQRVFQFAQTPFESPDGWQLCTCEEPVPAACLCDPDCRGHASTSGTGSSTGG